MTGILQNYLPLVVFIGVASLIGLVLLIAPFLVAFQQPDPEKLSAYECGFNAFDDARMKFDVRFYLVAILFIIFDLEVAFLFPWAVAFGKLGATGFAYDAARRFGLRMTETRPGLVPLTFGDDLLAMMRPLTGVSLETEASHGRPWMMSPRRVATAVAFVLSVPADTTVSRVTMGPNLPRT